MKNKKKFLFFFFCISSLCNAQWNARIANPQADFFTTDAFLDSLFRTLPADTGEGSDALQYARWRSFWQNRMGSGIEQQKSGSFRHAYDAFFSLMQDPVCDAPSSIPANWSLVGPITLSQQKIGRVDALAQDPNNSSIVYAGTPSGGLWRTLDINASLPVWQNVTDNTHLPGLGISDILIDPTNSNVVYIATGQQSFYGSYGVGVLKSNNALSSNPQWNLTDLKYSPSVGEKIVVKKLLMHPSNNQIIYAITATEVFQTTNGGITWPSLNLQGTASNLNINLTNIAFNPLNSNIIYVSTGTGELWKGDVSVSPTQWINITSGLSSIPAQKPIFISAAGSNLYVYYQSTVTAICGLGPNSNKRIDISTDGGITWNCYNSTPSGIYRDGCTFIVSPQNQNMIYVGDAVNRVINKSIDGGVSFTNISVYNGIYNGVFTHADIRGLELESSSTDGLNDVLLAGTDGGILFSTSAIPPLGTTVNWKDATGTGLAISQFFAFDDSEINNDLLVGGLQDNGMAAHDNGIWTININPIGDGYNGGIDKQNPVIAYGEGNPPCGATPCSSPISVPKSINSGLSWSNALVQPVPYCNPANPCLTTVNWNILSRPMQFSENNILHLAHLDLFQYNAGNNTWTAISDFTSLGVQSCTKINTIDISKSNTDVIYVALASPTWNFDMSSCDVACITPCSTQCALPALCPLSKKLWKTIDGGVTWQDISAGLEAVRWAPITGIAIDPNNPNRVWVSFGDIWFDPNLTPPYNGFGRFWRTDDGGQSWFDYTNGLPSFPVNAIVYEQGSNDGLYVGTDVGVFYRNKSMNQWICFNDNLPPCMVFDLEINYSQNKIRAATWGRGIWESNLACPSNFNLAFTTANSSNLSNTFQEAENDITLTANTGNINLSNFTARAGNEIIVTATGNNEVVIGPNSHLFIHACNHPGNSFRQAPSNSPKGGESPILFSSANKEDKKIYENENVKYTFYPNPFTNHLHIDFFLEKPSLIQVSVYNGMGQLIEILAKGNYQAEEHTVLFNNPSVKPGMYFVKISTGEKSFVRAVIKTAAQ